jgi:hypothetical protein
MGPKKLQKGTRNNDREKFAVKSSCYLSEFRKLSNFFQSLLLRLFVEVKENRRSRRHLLSELRRQENERPKPQLRLIFRCTQCLLDDPSAFTRSPTIELFLSSDSLSAGLMALLDDNSTPILRTIKGRKKTRERLGG